MKRHLLRLAEAINAQGVRQRLLIFMALLLLTGGLYYLALQGLLLRQAELTQTIKKNNASHKDLSQQIERWMRTVNQDPNSQNQQRRDLLQAQIAQSQADLDRLQAGKLTPARMAQLLESLLRDKHRLHSVSIQSFSEAFSEASATGTVSGTAPGQKPAEPAKATGLYKQGVRVTVRGNYVDLVNYLATLEQQPWKVIWGEATFRVDRYPTGTLSFTLYTLSPDKSWLRV